MVENYIYKVSERECYLAGQKLPKVRENSFKSVFQHAEAQLIIEKIAEKTFEITLKDVKFKLPTVYNGEFEDETDNDWHLEDYGRLIWSEEKQDYALEKGHPKIFVILVENFDSEPEIEFYFDFFNHLVQKDKDQIKPWYYYQWDIIPPLAGFIYRTLSPYVKKEQGDIVALPAEQGQALAPWWANGHEINDQLGSVIYGEESLDNDYDFYWETSTNWIKTYDRLPALVISFLPTYFKNYQLEEKYKMTGTRWFKKLMSVFGENEIPIVLRCYPGFVYTNLYFRFPEYYARISAIVELPPQIKGRAMDTGNLLVFFNCPFLKKSEKGITKIKYE